MSYYKCLENAKPGDKIRLVVVIKNYEGFNKGTWLYGDELDRVPEDSRTVKECIVRSNKMDGKYLCVGIDDPGGEKFDSIILTAREDEAIEYIHAIIKKQL